jgi:tripartite-type tricarboxylate transporter receptor subunit TctC
VVWHGRAQEHASTPTAIVVNGASPYRTLADLFKAARAKPAS